MCHECPSNLNSLGSERVMPKVRKFLKEIEKQTDKLLALADTVQASYRDAGIAYHTTHPSARQPRDDNPGSLALLKAAFEISRIEEYQAIFAPLNAFIQRVTELRSDVQHAGFHGTVQERYHHCFKELFPALGVLLEEFDQMFNKFEALEYEADILRSISRFSYDINNGGYRTAWQDPYQAEGEHFIPARMQEEWNTFRAWVWSLPETQRVTTAGYRSLDEVALGLAFSEEEKEE